jgi:hypothetical protein
LTQGQKYLEIFQCDLVDYRYEKLEMVNNKIIKKVRRFDTSDLIVTQEEGRLSIELSRACWQAYT